MNFVLQNSSYFIILLSVILVLSFQSQNPKSFEQINEKLTQLKDVGKYQDAISLLENISDEFSEEEYIISKELAFLYGKIGQYEKGIEIWKDGHRRGYFYGIFPHFPIYKPFKQFSQFNEIINEDKRLKKKAIEKSKTVFEIILPENYNPNHPYPLFIILHGGGSSIKQAKKYWKSPLLDKEYIRVFIQSYLFVDMNTFSWGIKDKRARKDIRECYNAIVKEYSIDIESVIIGGISAGAYTAMDIAIHAIIPVQGFFAVCPETELSDYEEQSINDVAEGGMQSMIISGEHDYFLDQQKKVIELLRTHGFSVQFEVIDNIGHEYPKDFVKWIDLAILNITDKFPALKGEYLGQKKPGKTPEIFAPGIISTSGKEFAGTFSHNGQEYYFTRSGGEKNLKTNTIMFTKIINGQWIKPQIASFSGQYFDFEPHITPDGTKLFFGSRRPVKENDNLNKMHQWYLEKTDSGWSNPKLVGLPIFDYPAMYISVAGNGHIYFSVDTEEAGIWISKFINGDYQKPEKLSNQINYLPAVLHPHIAPDESYLIFDAQPKGQNTDPDLFISFHKPDKSWKKAVSMGEKINVSREMCPSVSPDGKYFFFSRDGDIYWLNTEFLIEIKKKLFN